MVIVALIIVGLCLGSFVNALVWRIHEQDTAPSKKVTKSTAHQDLSIMHGRSMCPHCRHQLSAYDLIPVVSWLSLSGKCRYCNKPISWQYPVVELTTALLYVLSYHYWPSAIHGPEVVVFGLWLALLVGFMALSVYDLKWYLLPNRIVYPLGYIAGLLAFVRILSSPNPSKALVSSVLGVAIGGGIFYVLFQVSKGKWIGGGDVKLGWLLGLALGSPSYGLLYIFLAALGGSLVSIPLLITKRLKPNTIIPFGPFLLGGAVVVMLFGHSLLYWYKNTLLIGPY